MTISGQLMRLIYDFLRECQRPRSKKLTAIRIPAVSENRSVLGKLGFALAIFVSIFQTNLLDAQDRSWSNGTNINPWYDVGSNWIGGNFPNSTETAVFGLPGNYQVWWDSNTASIAPSVGRVRITSGTVNFLNQSTLPTQHLFTINLGNQHDGFQLNSSALRVNGIHMRSLVGGSLTSGVDLSYLMVDGAHTSGTKVSFLGNGLRVNSGNVDVLAGGVLETASTQYQQGFLNVSGNGSTWNAGSVTLGTTGGGGTTSNITVQNGGTMNSSSVTVFGSGMGSTIHVAGVNSRLTNSGVFNVANGRIVVENHGEVNSSSVMLGTSGIGRAIVNSEGSLNINGNLNLGSVSGTAGIVEIGGNGVVNVTGNTTITASSEVVLDGGRFEFGTMDMAGMSRISGTSGSLAGTINHTGYTNVASLTAFQGSSLVMTDVIHWNSGGLYGNAALGNSIVNTSSGEVETLGTERMRFAGSGTNAGRMNIFGGQLRFGMHFYNAPTAELNNFGHTFSASQVWNAAGGMISGRGQFMAANGWTNLGVMAFSNGTTDIHGNVINQMGGKIITSGNGTTTFYGDVIHNGSEIRTSAGSSTVFFGGLTGSGALTGSGSVFVEGDLRPGNSPGTISFGGNLILSSSASTTIELGGIDFEKYDRLLVSGDLFLGNSQLNVELWDGFTLGNNMQFLIAEIGGNRFGTFANLSEGALVGSFGGHDLFITYNAGVGNGIALFTGVPEPSAAVLVAVLATSFCFRRRRETAFQG
jgi:hypothetical protein